MRILHVRFSPNCEILVKIHILKFSQSEILTNSKDHFLIFETIDSSDFWYFTETSFKMS